MSSKLRTILHHLYRDMAFSNGNVNLASASRGKGRDAPLCSEAHPYVFVNRTYWFCLPHSPSKRFCTAYLRTTLGNCQICFACCLWIFCQSVSFPPPMACAQWCNTAGEEQWGCCTHVGGIINFTDLLTENWNFISDIHNESCLVAGPSSLLFLWDSFPTNFICEGVNNCSENIKVCV